MIFTPGILVHKYHKTRGDQKSPPRGINFTTTLIKRFQNPGECDFHPGDSSSQILKTRGDQYLHPGDPITQITQSADFKTRGTWSPPGELISFYSKNCQILQPGGSNSSNSQSQSSQLKPRGHSIFQSSLFNFTIWQFYNPGGYIDSGRGHVPSSYSQTRGASKKGGRPQ